MVPENLQVASWITERVRSYRDNHILDILDIEATKALEEGTRDGPWQDYEENVPKNNTATPGKTALEVDRESPDLSSDTDVVASVGKTVNDADPKSQSDRAVIDYLDQIKSRYVSQPEVYKRFSETLEAYAHGAMPIPAVYAQIVTLFSKDRGLVEAFKQFLVPTFKIGAENKNKEPDANRPERSASLDRIAICLGSHIPPEILHGDSCTIENVEVSSSKFNMAKATIIFRERAIEFEEDSGSVEFSRHVYLDDIFTWKIIGSSVGMTASSVFELKSDFNPDDSFVPRSPPTVERNVALHLIPKRLEDMSRFETLLSNMSGKRTVVSEIPGVTSLVV